VSKFDKSGKQNASYTSSEFETEAISAMAEVVRRDTFALFGIPLECGGGARLFHHELHQGR